MMRTRFVLPVLLRGAVLCLLAVSLGLYVSTNRVSAATYTWNITGSGSWDNAANWNPNTGFPNAIDDVANLTNNVTGNRTVTLSIPVTVGTLGIGDSNFSHTFALAGAGPLTFDVSSGTAAINKPVAGSNKVDTISVPLILADSLIITNSATATGAGSRLVISGVISETGGPMSITKLGTGRVELTGQSTFTGGVTLSVSTLTVNATSSTGGPGAVVSGPLGRGTFTLDGGNFVTNSGVDDSNTLSNDVILNAVPTNAIALNGTTLMDGLFSGPGGFTKNSDGVLTLTGLNTYTGTTSIGNGVIAVNTLANVGQNSSLGAPALAESAIVLGNTDPLSTNPSALKYVGTAAVSTDRVVSLSYAAVTALEQGGSGSVTFTSPLGFSVAVDRTLTLAGVGPGLAEFAGAVADNGANITSLTKSGYALWTLSGGNGYTGPTTVTANSGALRFANRNALYGDNSLLWTTTNMNVNASSAMIFSVGVLSTDFSLAQIDTFRSTLGGVTNGFMPGSSIGIDTTNNGATLTYTSDLTDFPGSGFNGYAKMGTHDLVLTGNNSYTGPTSVISGTLVKGTLTAIPADTPLVFGLINVATPVGTLDLGSFDQTISLLYARGNSTDVNSILLADTKNLTLNASALVTNAIVIGTDDDVTGPNTSRLAITGTNNIFQVNAAGKNIVVAQSSSITGSALFDLSGIGTFNATIANLYVGRPTDAAGAAQPNANNRSTGILRLATLSNTIDASGDIVVGSASGTSYLTGNELRLGTANTLTAARLVVGNGRSSGLLSFNTGLTNPTVTIHGIGGPPNRLPVFVGDGLNLATVGSGANGSTSTTGTLDFTGGTVTAMISELRLGTGGTAASNVRGEGNGVLIVDGVTSIVDINDVTIGSNRAIDTSATPNENPGVASNSFLTIHNGAVTINTSLLIANDLDTSNTATGIQNVLGTITVNGGSLTIGAFVTPVNTTFGQQVVGGNAGTITPTLLVNGGTVNSFGSFLRGTLGNGTINSTVTVEGGSLDMNNYTIGAVGAEIGTLNFRSGTLSNVAEINGGAPFVKTTNGTLVLAGANGFTGTTDVSAGTLSVTGTHTGLGAYGVNSGATLRGNGSIAAAVAVNSTGTIRAGTSVGVLTVGGGLAVNPGGSIYVELLSGSTPAAAAASTGNSTDTTSLPASALNNNNFLEIIGGVTTIDPSATLIVNATGANLTDSTSYSFQIGRAASSQAGVNINLLTQFTFTGFANGDPVVASLTGDASGALYLNFTTAVIPEPTAFLSLAALAWVGFRRRK